MKIFDMLKKNRLGAMVGGVAGITNFGAGYVAEFLRSIPSGDILVTPTCNPSTLPAGAMCQDVIQSIDLLWGSLYEYAPIGIALLILIGAYIQSKVKK